MNEQSSFGTGVCSTRCSFYGSAPFSFLSLTFGRSLEDSPRAELLLPGSWAIVTSPEFHELVPSEYVTRVLEVIVEWWANFRYSVAELWFTTVISDEEQLDADGFPATRSPHPGDLQLADSDLPNPTNTEALESLRSRIVDWKGHRVEDFGQLLLHDFFTVTKSDIDRKYWVFFFEKILVCVKEFTPEQKPKAKKLAGFLKKQTTPTTSNSTDHPQRRNTPLQIKGRLFIGNMTQAVPVRHRGSSELPVTTKFRSADV